MALRHLHKQAVFSPADVDMEALKRQGIVTLVFDYDGILAAHGKPVPDAIGLSLLNHAVALFPQVCILSNKANALRQSYFAAEYPTVRFITGVEKKPYPYGLQKILQDTHTTAEKTCIIDDRLTTGCLAGLLAGVQVVFVSHATKDYRYAFFKELWFDILRWLERLYLS